MRYFITLSYDGTRYHGWQIQPNGISVQETLQQAANGSAAQTAGNSQAGLSEESAEASQS